MSNKKFTLKLPFGKNDNEQDYMDTVYNHFNGFDIEYKIEDGFCELCLIRSDFLYCEDFESMFESIGITSEMANSYLKFGKRSSLFFSDAWFYYVYTNIIGKYYNSESNIVIIHVDDHKDMMAPFIGYKNNDFYNLLEGRKVDIQNVNDVIDMIDSGVITIGSMMTPLFFSKDNITVIHLTNELEEEAAYSIKTEVYTDTVLTGDIGRIHLEKKPMNTGNSKYISVNNPYDIIKLVNESDFVLLHYDMDYFNNRFNGSNDWEFGEGHHNPGFDEQKRKMDEICKALSALIKKVPIIHTAIGLSPSFYPNEYWRIGVEYLLSSLFSIGIDTCDLYELLKKEGWF